MSCRDFTAMRRVPLFVVIALSLAGRLAASAITVTPVSLVSRSPGTHTARVRLAVAWDSSWRNDLPGTGRAEPFNFDAAWLFLKYRVGSGAWQHARLSARPLDHAAVALNAGATLTPATDGAGVFVYRAANGQGRFAPGELELTWDYGASGVADDAPVTLHCFALEMVLIPEGAFFVGDGSPTTNGRFHAGGRPGTPYQVAAAAPRFANDSGGLWADNTLTNLPTGVPGPSPWDNPGGSLGEAWPTGYAAFFSMKHEITQGQYAEFLNHLTLTQAAARFPTDADFTGAGTVRPGNYRFTITNAGDLYIAAAPSYANNWMTWEDGIAYADWSGLRPMTEFEYEKAGRGPLPAVAGEYAWGTTTIAPVSGFNGTDGSGTETPQPANANTSLSPTTQNRPLLGPYRVGLFEGNATREQRGAGYYGVLDLSGNVVEQAVNLSSPGGRAFTGNHGDGSIGADGRARDVPSWPRIPVNAIGAFSASYGFGFRGGDFYNPELDLRLSSRNVASFGGARRLFGLGFRAVRTAPLGTPASTGGASRLVNLSTRAFVGTGGDILIPGIVIGGTAPKTILVRAVGPTLAAFGVSGVLADPRVSILQDQTTLATNDDWETNPNLPAVAVATAQVGAFALQPRSKDAALIITLRPGAYTAQVAGAANSTGIALIEIYECESEPSSQ
jgi:formylglycine-generating enzyme required for sulfatase activity